MSSISRNGFQRVNAGIIFKIWFGGPLFPPPVRRPPDCESKVRLPPQDSRFASAEETQFFLYQIACQFKRNEQTPENLQFPGISQGFSMTCGPKLNQYAGFINAPRVKMALNSRLVFCLEQHVKKTGLTRRISSTPNWFYRVLPWRSSALHLAALRSGWPESQPRRPGLLWWPIVGGCHHLAFGLTNLDRPNHDLGTTVSR